MASVTAASSFNMDMISRLMLAGQVKLVGASASKLDATTNGNGTTVPSIAIPALTGSQIAIVYLELAAESTTAAVSCPCNFSATGSGFTLGVNISPQMTSSSANFHIAASQYFRNSAFGTTTTGSQTITFTATPNVNALYITAQAAVFIYTPPF